MSSVRGFGYAIQTAPVTSRRSLSGSRPPVSHSSCVNPPPFFNELRRALTNKGISKKRTVEPRSLEMHPKPVFALRVLWMISMLLKRAIQRHLKLLTEQTERPDATHEPSIKKFFAIRVWIRNRYATLGHAIRIVVIDATDPRLSEPFVFVNRGVRQAFFRRPGLAESWGYDSIFRVVSTRCGRVKVYLFVFPRQAGSQDSPMSPVPSIQRSEL